MLKQRHFMLATAVLTSAVTLGCGLSSGDDDDGATPGQGGMVGAGGSDTSFGGASVSFGGSTTTNGGGVGFGGSTGTSGGGPSTPGTFDGGSVPITQGDRDAITGQACAGFLTEPETLPAVLELVIDVSSSMNERAPNPDQNVRLSKWEVTRDALLEAIPGVTGPGLAPSLAIGMLFYPNITYQVSRTPQDVSTCVNTGAMVPIATLGPKGAPQRTLVQQGIASVQLQQSTPTFDAYTYAYNNGLVPSKAPGQRFMLLITDGTPTLSEGCHNPSGNLSGVDPNPIVSAITNVAKTGVKTFLIGSPGSEPNRTWMSTAAVIGGTAEPGCNINGPKYCHMDMTTAPDFAASLRAGLAKVVGQITPCTFAFAEPPPGEQIDPSKINVIITSNGQSNLIVRDDIGDCTEGWQLTANNELLLCPDTCTALKADAFAQADVVFGCASTDVPPR